MADHMSSGELQRLLGVSRARLRDWESKGIVSPVRAQRKTRVWREFPPDQVDRVRGILALLADGFTLQGALRHLSTRLTRTGQEELGAPGNPNV